MLHYILLGCVAWRAANRDTEFPRYCQTFWANISLQEPGARKSGNE
ncbi:hypothetical protein [Pleionea sediminis]|nr:hypothetical protein [Pleionea sediminis]